MLKLEICTYYVYIWSLFMHIFDMPIQVALVIGSISAIRTTKRFFPSVDSNMDFQIFPTFHNGRTEWAHITVLTKSYWSVLERTKEIYLWEICSFLNHCFFLNLLSQNIVFLIFIFTSFLVLNLILLRQVQIKIEIFLEKKQKIEWRKEKSNFFFYWEADHHVFHFLFKNFNYSHFEVRFSNFHFRISILEFK